MTKKLLEIKSLINKLNKASEVYYNTGTDIMSDGEFDYYLSKLASLEKEVGFAYSNSPTQTVGAPVLTQLNKVKIEPKLMLSLNKIHSAEEIINFNKNKDALIASVKCDGLSVRIKYRNGKLLSANTRGDGYEGTDITEHIKQFLNVPLIINKTEDYIVDGEAVILESDFAEINKDNEFKNPRNTASGALSLLDTSIVKKRKLSFILWDVIEGDPSNNLNVKLSNAKKLGFFVVPYDVIIGEILTKVDTLNSINKSLLEKAEELGIPCDGIVWKIDNIEYGEYLGKTSHHYLNAVAWKPKVELYESHLINIEWSEGRTGVLTPIAVFKPINIDGTVVERASLHNVSVMREILGNFPYEKQSLQIFKANSIIPQIKSSDIKPLKEITNAIFVPPTLCVNCHQDTIIKENNGVKVLYCTNPSCCGKLINRLDHFCSIKGLNIKGLSKATLEKLVDWNWVKKISDIYNLKNYANEWKNKVGFGEASVNKILKSIEDSKNCNLSSFIAAIGIPLVGKNVAKEICNYFKTYNNFREAIKNKFDFSKIDNFAIAKTEALLNFDYAEADLIYTYLNIIEEEDQKNNSNNNKNNTITNMIFCITGKLQYFNNRNSLIADIESKGGKVVNNISKKVNYLINNDLQSNSEKNKKAILLNIPIMSEKDYLILSEGGEKIS